MEAAYSLQGLGEKLAAKGLPVALDGLEVTAAQAYAAVKEWLDESAKLSANPIDDVVVSFLPQLDVLVLPQIDKISPGVETK